MLKRCMIGIFVVAVLIAFWKFWQFCPISLPEPAKRYYCAEIAGKKYFQNQGGNIQVPPEHWKNGLVRVSLCDLPEDGSVSVFTPIEERMNYMGSKFPFGEGKRVIWVFDKRDRLISKQVFNIIPPRRDQCTIE